MYFLFDCDNFFVSCERVFAPALKKVPVVVLSNNDGCVVSRSYEAKALGIPMGAPYFQIERFLSRHHGVAISSNHEFYADMSRRIMSILRNQFPELEVYSIDEAFARVSATTRLEEIALHTRNQLLQQTGISVSVGIAPTKTLCKIAARQAKQKECDKIFLLNKSTDIRSQLEHMDVNNVWGVGRHLSPKLGYLGIFTAWDLATAPLQQIRHCFDVRLAKTVLELNGTPCLEIEGDDTSQSLTTSRSFEREISDYEQLTQIIAEFTDKSALRLRRQNAVARGVTVFLRTNRFAKDKEQYNNAAYISLNSPTSHTGKLIHAARQALQQVYRHGLEYKSAGVILKDIQPINQVQTTFFDSAPTSNKEQTLMSALDKLNHRFGAKTVRFAPQAPNISPLIRQDHRTHLYTTSWDELPTVS